MSEYAASSRVLSFNGGLFSFEPFLVVGTPVKEIKLIAEKFALANPRSKNKIISLLLFFFVLYI